MPRWERQRVEIFDWSSLGRFNEALSLAVVDAVDVAEWLIALECVDKLERGVLALISYNDVNKIVRTQQLLCHKRRVISPHRYSSVRVHGFCDLSDSQCLFDRRCRRLHAEQIDAHLRDRALVPLQVHIKSGSVDDRDVDVVLFEHGADVGETERGSG